MGSSVSSLIIVSIDAQSLSIASCSEHSGKTFCAHFAVGVNSGIYSKTIVRRLAGRYLIYLYDKLEPLIQKKRQVNTLERHYYEFEMLIADIKKYYT